MKELEELFSSHFYVEIYRKCFGGLEDWEIYIRKNSFLDGTFKDERVRLRMMATVYVMGKGMAEVAQDG